MTKIPHKKLYILIGFVCIILAVGLFVTGIVQTFVLKDLQYQTNQTQNATDILERQAKQAEDETAFKESEEYIDEYFHSKEEAKEGETIYK